VIKEKEKIKRMILMRASSKSLNINKEELDLEAEIVWRKSRKNLL